MRNHRMLPGSALALVTVLVLALAVPALAAHSQPESWQALTGQVNGGKVESALIVPKKSEVRVRLKDGTHYIAVYPAGTTPASIQSSFRAHGATATIHKAKAGSSGHVRYRYIALAILALGALAALGYYLLRGRPAAQGPRRAGNGTAPAEAAAPPPPTASAAARGEDGAPPGGA
jgi:ATP-dependent Zn protease